LFPSHDRRGSASLKAWGYRLADHKIDFKDFSEYSEEMLRYCQQDVHVTKQLWNYIVSKCYPTTALQLEHEFAYAINRQIRSGVPFDFDAALDLVDDLRTKQNELECKLKEVFPPNIREETFIPKVNNTKRGYVKGQPFIKRITEEFNPGSRQQIVSRLTQKYGWVPEKRTEKGNPILDDDVLEKLPYPEAKLLAEYMLVKKRLGQIADGNNAWLKLVNHDSGRMHGDVVTNGCFPVTIEANSSKRASVRSPLLWSWNSSGSRWLGTVMHSWIAMRNSARSLPDGVFSNLIIKTFRLCCLYYTDGCDTLGHSIGQFLEFCPILLASPAPDRDWETSC
jgi:hypothetical protein